MQTKRGPRGPLGVTLAALVSPPPVRSPFLLHGPPQGCTSLLGQLRIDLR